MYKITITVLLLLVLAVGVFYSIQRGSSPQPNQQTPPNQNIVFLNSCKAASDPMDCYKKRLLAYAEKNGVAKTLGVIRETKENFPEISQNCNYPLGHELGIKAYKETRDVSKAFKMATECRAGFVRGVMAEFTDENKNVDFATLKEKTCLPEQSSEWRCYYRLGYLAMHKADSFSSALNTCQIISKDQLLRNGCFVGTIHEEIFRISTDAKYKIRYNSGTYGFDEETNLCNAMIETEYKQSCYPWIARKFLFYPVSEREKFFEHPTVTCQKVPASYKTSCYMGVGITLELIFEENRERIRDSCMAGPPINLQSSWDCFTGAIGISGRTVSPEAAPEKRKLCELIPEIYRENFAGEYKNLCGK